MAVREMMLTRAFLLLLVMMAGFSPAHAADNTHAARGALSLSAALAQTRVVAADLVEKRNICELARTNRIDQFVAALVVGAVAPASRAPMAPRTYLADRART